MDDIVQGLQDALREKKFLVVLDDVWNENFDDWYKLKTPLMVGEEGSKILVTTRSVKVAELMEDKFPYYELGILNHNYSWSLFKEIAFGSATGAVETPKLVEIGKEMVKRCGDLPLAVIFLGSLMRSKKKEEEWKNIRDTKIWHESQKGEKSEHRILPSLRLSYDHLPSHLKQCFSYCCLFPKDWKIQRETLIRLWMAEGFLIESPEENAMSMEEIGNEYFDNLLCNFFFHDVERNGKGDIVTCKMHDLVHDLASSVVGKNESLIIENAHDIDCISEATIRLNLVNVNEDIFPKLLEGLKNAKNLRTVFVNYRPRTCKMSFFDMEKDFNKNKRLRVLDLRGAYYYIGEALPTSIGGLKHLRYLHLPEDSIIPKGIGRLRFLQTLNEFNLGYDYNKNAGVGGGIEELECLNHLRGDLSISHLERVTSGTAACRANLKEKKRLRGLNLFWEGDDHHAINNNHEVVVEGLRPPPNLTTLRIDGFHGSKLPRWIIQNSSSCLPNLSFLIIINCPVLTTITPTTTILPSLKFLYLDSSDGKAVKSLVTNKLHSLTSLALDGISNLFYLPHQGLMENNNTLLYLSISSCPQFIGFIRSLPDNEEEDDDDQGQQQQLQISPSSSSSLQYLKLYDCPSLWFYPNIRSLTSLQELEIQICKESMSLQDHLTCLSSSSLEHEPLVYVKILKNKTSATEEVLFEWRKSSFCKDH